MKRLCQGIQAVTVELLGVLLVVWMLFGFTAMGLHSVSGRPPALSASITQRMTAWKNQLATNFFRQTPAKASHQDYVANRLDYFSQSYSLAAHHHFDELLNEFDHASPMVSR